MRALPRASIWIRTAEALVLAVAVCFSLGATSAASRFDNLSRQLMCTCGCAQLVGECDHAGCTSRAQEMTELTAGIAGGKTDQQIMSAFAAKYGATVLAAPPARGFDLLAWVAPFAVFGAAIVGTILLIRHWGNLPGGRMEPIAESNPATMTPEERARLEQIRRETGTDGGF